MTTDPREGLIPTVKSRSPSCRLAPRRFSIHLEFTPPDRFTQPRPAIQPARPGPGHNAILASCQSATDKLHDEQIRAVAEILRQMMEEPREPERQIRLPSSFPTRLTIVSYSQPHPARHPRSVCRIQANSPERPKYGQVRITPDSEAKGQKGTCYGHATLPIQIRDNQRTISAPKVTHSSIFGSSATARRSVPPERKNLPEPLASLPPPKYEQIVAASGGGLRPKGGKPKAIAYPAAKPNPVFGHAPGGAPSVARGTEWDVLKHLEKMLLARCRGMSRNVARKKDSLKSKGSELLIPLTLLGLRSRFAEPPLRRG